MLARAQVTGVVGEVLIGFYKLQETFLLLVTKLCHLIDLICVLFTSITTTWS